MTDQEIIQGLIERDNLVTKEFFFVKCRPLFCSIIQKVFDYDVDYDELVNELYVYLMEDDAAKLHTFEYRSSVYQWLKVLAIRFFMKRKGQMIDDTSQESLYDRHEMGSATEADALAKEDLGQLLTSMPTKRYAHVIRRLIIEGWKPEQLAQEMGITTANLYNIKRRAMAQLTLIAFNDIKEYGK